MTVRDQIDKALSELPNSVEMGHAHVDRAKADEGWKIKNARYGFSYSIKGYGFGTFNLIMDGEGNFYVDSEYTGRERTKEAMNAILDLAIFDTDLLASSEADREAYRAAIDHEPSDELYVQLKENNRCQRGYITQLQRKIKDLEAQVQETK